YNQTDSGSAHECRRTPACRQAFRGLSQLTYWRRTSLPPITPFIISRFVCMASSLCRFPGVLGLIGLVGGLAHAQDSIEPKFLSNIRQVTSGFVKAGEGYFSPDGKQIIYQAQPLDYPFYQIYTQPLRGAGVSLANGAIRPKRISTGRGRTTCSYFSPDGRRTL